MRSAGRSVAPNVPPAGDGRGTSCPVPQWPGPAAVASSPRGDGRRTRATASWSGARRAAHAIAARFHRDARGAHRRVQASRRALCGVPGQSRAAGAHPRRPRPSARPGGRHRPWPALDRPLGAGQAHGTAGATWRCRSIPNSPGCQGLDVEAGADRCRSRRPAGASGPTSCPVARSHRMAAGTTGRRSRCACRRSRRSALAEVAVARARLRPSGFAETRPGRSPPSEG